MDLSVLTIQSKIHEIRGLKVMLDFDLAEMYEVDTKTLKQAIKEIVKGFLLILCLPFPRKSFRV